MPGLKNIGQMGQEQGNKVETLMEKSMVGSAEGGDDCLPGGACREREKGLAVAVEGHSR